MDLFDEILKNARREKFVTSFCLKCNKYIWPPDSSCNICYSSAILRDVTSNGVLLSKSISHIEGKKRYFGLGEFDGIRIIGTIDSSINIDDKIIICGVSETYGKIDLKFCSDM
jgi:uncharacterized OB-fold protein